nr:T9SS type A sorting domain-containing protein [Bacteroidales bacterium]
MKKLFTIIVLLLAMCTLSAQDTVTFDDCRYMCYPRPTTYWYESFREVSFEWDAAPIRTPMFNRYTFYKTNSPINIYGIAITADESIAPYTMAYISQVRNDTLYVIRSSSNMRRTILYGYKADYRISYIHDTANHTFTMDTVYDPIYEYRPCMEFYFDSAVQVTDSFLVSYKITDYSNAPSNAKYYTMCRVKYIDNGTPHNGMYFQLVDNNSIPVVLPGGIEEPIGYLNWGGMFPITVLDTSSTTDPPDTTDIDTTGTGGGDTVGISAVTGQAAIDIAPNPTDNVTTVSSSVPLRMVEAYDVAGRLLLRQPATGRTAKIDMSGYRPGCYILKIHTSAGTAH